MVILYLKIAKFILAEPLTLFPEYVQSFVKLIALCLEHGSLLMHRGVYLNEEAKKQFEIGAKELESLYKDANEKFYTLSSKAEENYKEVKDFAELTNKALKHSFNYFMSHYRKK